MLWFNPSKTIFYIPKLLVLVEIIGFLTTVKSSCTDRVALYAVFEIHWQLPLYFIQQINMHWYILKCQ